MKSTKAEVGIGTLIIFIAMILVAAIAAGVLLQTASSLQDKALMTGQKSKTQVSTSLTTIMMYGEDGTDQDLENFYVKARIAAGSDPISLKDLLISFDLNNISADLSYKTGNCTPNTGFNTNPATGRGNFTVEYLIKSINHMPGYIRSGDVVQLCFEAPRNVYQDEIITVNMVPKVGIPTAITTSTPDVITTKRVVVYP